MDFPNIKSLKKLAEACRKSGITNFKLYQDGSYEFNIDPSQVVQLPKKASKQTISEASALVETNAPSNGLFQTDSPTEDELMFWSSTSANDIVKSGKESQ